jgi:hypothetical protein
MHGQDGTYTNNTFPQTYTLLQGAPFKCIGKMEHTQIIHLHTNIHTSTYLLPRRASQMNRLDGTYTNNTFTHKHTHIYIPVAKESPSNEHAG